MRQLTLHVHSICLSIGRSYFWTWGVLPHASVHRNLKYRDSGLTPLYMSSLLKKNLLNCTIEFAVGKVEMLNFIEEKKKKPLRSE